MIYFIKQDLPKCNLRQGSRYCRACAGLVHIHDKVITFVITTDLKVEHYVASKTKCVQTFIRFYIRSVILWLNETF